MISTSSVIFHKQITELFEHACACDNILFSAIGEFLINEACILGAMRNELEIEHRTTTIMRIL